jgi:hypothetical protein
VARPIGDALIGPVAAEPYASFGEAAAAGIAAIAMIPPAIASDPATFTIPAIFLAINCLPLFL